MTWSDINDKEPNDAEKDTEVTDYASKDTAEHGAAHEERVEISEMQKQQGLRKALKDRA